MKKDNKVAIMVSNEALTALKWFGIEATAAGNSGIGYNDVVRRIYDALYKIKKTASNAAFLGEGIFTMGYSKNYIMYWGVFTVIIISRL